MRFEIRNLWMTAMVAGCFVFPASAMAKETVEMKLKIANESDRKAESSDVSGLSDVTDIPAGGAITVKLKTTVVDKNDGAKITGSGAATFTIYREVTENNVQKQQQCKVVMTVSADKSGVDSNCARPTITYDAGRSDCGMATESFNRTNCSGDISFTSDW